MFRNRTSHLQYHNFSQTGCPFCAKFQKPELIATTTHAQVVRNAFSYDVWEGKKVIDHLMILPKRHVASLGKLKPAELADIMKLMAEYEANNYNVYARGVANVTRSVVHQHTHLIKTTDKEAKFYFYSAKPYFVRQI
jgi:diadenosine tetraphosphate (Ap4A) HIT family hydrolase